MYNVSSMLYGRCHHQSPVKLTIRSHLPHCLDRLMYRTLRTLNRLLHQPLMLLSAFLYVWIPPFESIGHVVVMLRQTLAVGDSVCDQSTVGLPEVHLQSIAR